MGRNRNSADVGHCRLVSTLELRERLPKRLVRSSLRHPNFVILFWIALAILALPGVISLRIETSTDSVLDRGTDPWAFYQFSQSEFGGDELVVVAVSDTDPFSAELLEETIRLTRVLETVDGVRRVDSLATVPFIRGGPDGSLVLGSALETGIPPTREGRLSLLEELMKDRIAPRSLMSDDGRVLALNVYLEANLTRSFDEVISDITENVKSSNVRISGVPIFRTQINLRTGSEVSGFSVVTVLLVAACFRFLFGSLRATLVPILIGGLGGWLILGSMGFLGIPLSLSTMILPSILLALGCAYSTHYVFAIGREADIAERYSAAEEVALPVALSGLTTAIGFVAIAIVPIEALQQVGGLGALGAIVATGLALTLAPVILDRWPPRIGMGVGERWIGGVARRMILRAVARPNLVIALALALGFVGALGLPRLSIETDATKWFYKGSEVRDAYDGIRRDLSGISPINIVIEGEEGRYITEPDVINALDRLSTFLRAHGDVGKVLSIADPLLSVHEVFDPGSRNIDSRELSEQYMMLLSSEEQIWDFIEPEHNRANVLIRVDDNGSDRLLSVASEAESWWSQNGVQGFNAVATGIMYEFARAENRIAEGQILGVQLAVLSIGLLLLLIYRSWRLAGAALIANVIPILVAFGGMAWLRIPLDAGTVLVANLALGIAVDDTIHFASVYQDEPTLDSTLKKVLPALASTTIAVGAGFCVLGFSEFAFTRNLGILTALIMVLCFLADVVLLPCLLRAGGANKAADG
jgi:predicted RND superfamily exporter protein